jgi:hypothetical protein
MGYASALCPSGGFSALRRHFSSNSLWLYPNTTETLTFAGMHHLHRPLFLPSGDGILIQDSKGEVAPYVISGAIRGWSSIETSAIGSHGATINLAQRLNFDCYEAVMGRSRRATQLDRFRFYDDQTASIKSRVPAVRVVCAARNRNPVELYSCNISNFETI